MADEKKKGFWVFIGAMIVGIFGVFVFLISGGKISSIMEKAFKLIGKSEAKDEDRADAIKQGEEQKKENEINSGNAQKIAEEAKKKTEELNTEVENSKTSTEKLKEQLEKNKKFLEETK